MFKTLFLSLLCLAACEVCTAGSLFVTASGTFSDTDTADTYVTPGDMFSLTFLVPSSPITNGTNSTTLSFDVPVAGFTYELDGMMESVPAPTEITFYTAADGGGFEVDFGASTELPIRRWWSSAPPLLRTPMP